MIMNCRAGLCSMKLNDYELQGWVMQYAGLGYAVCRAGLCSMQGWVMQYAGLGYAVCRAGLCSMHGTQSCIAVTGCDRL